MLVLSFNYSTFFVQHPAHSLHLDVPITSNILPFSKTHFNFYVALTKTFLFLKKKKKKVTLTVPVLSLTHHHAALMERENGVNAQCCHSRLVMAEATRLHSGFKEKGVHILSTLLLFHTQFLVSLCLLFFDLVLFL